MEYVLLSSAPSPTIWFSILYLSLKTLTIFLGILRVLQTARRGGKLNAVRRCSPYLLCCFFDEPKHLLMHIGHVTRG